jgi:dTDP-4-amino-4,6-dideoxygalactose transaminase
MSNPSSSPKPRAAVSAELPKIQVAKPYFPAADIADILRDTRTVLESGMLMQGPFVRRFEEEFARYVGVRHARAVNSGTSALHGILEYYDIADREVIVPVNTFLATANAVLFAGGRPVFAEIRPDTLLVDFDDLVRRVTPKTAGVVIVHVAGLIGDDVERIRDFCRDRGLFVIEDAAHAAGSSRQGQKAGSFCDAAAFSLLATKIITSAGEGGIVATDDEALAHRITSLRFHGEDTKRGIQDRIGYSWRMTEMQAIVGATQVRRLDEIVGRRMAIAAAYDRGVARLENVHVLPLRSGDRNAYYKYPLHLRPPLDRRAVQARLDAEFGVRTGTSYWPPCHLQPAYRKAFGYKEGDYPVAEAALDRTIALPMHCDLTDDEIRRVITAVGVVCG